MYTPEELVRSISFIAAVISAFAILARLSLAGYRSFRSRERRRIPTADQQNVTTITPIASNTESSEAHRERFLAAGWQKDQKGVLTFPMERLRRKR